MSRSRAPAHTMQHYGICSCISGRDESLRPCPGAGITTYLLGNSYSDSIAEDKKTSSGLIARRIPHGSYAPAPVTMNRCVTLIFPEFKRCTIRSKRKRNFTLGKLM